MNPSPVPFRVFLSHNHANKEVARELKAKLVERGLTVWLDKDELRPGMPWQQEIEKGIRASDSVAVLVGRDGLGPWEDEEMQGALIIAVKSKHPVIPVLLPGAPQVELPMFLGTRTWVDLRPGLTSEGLDELYWGITGTKFADKKKRRSEPPAPPPPPPPPTPPPPAATLLDVLPGVWQIQIQAQFGQGAATLELLPNGLFRGEVASPLGRYALEGQWQANPFTRQIGLQGRQFNGFQAMPYVAAMQVTYFDRQQILGITADGAQTVWQRTAPPAA